MNLRPLLPGQIRLREPSLQAIYWLPSCPDFRSYRTGCCKDGNQLKALSNIKLHVGEKTGIS